MLKVDCTVKSLLILISRSHYNVSVFNVINQISLKHDIKGMYICGPYLLGTDVCFFVSLLPSIPAICKANLKDGSAVTT